MSVIVFILVLSFLILIHELGHFLAARGGGIKVEEFGLGYPPRAATLFKWQETIFSLNWIPFGGFVRIEGEDEPEGKFQTYPAGRRLLVVLAGVLVNFIFGIIAFALVFSVAGIPQALDQPRIAQIAPNSPAATAGLQAETNFKTLATDQEKLNVENTEQVINFVEEHRGQEVSVTTVGPCQELSCDDEISTKQVYLRTAEETPAGEGAMGIVFQGVIRRHYPWYEMPFRGSWYGLNQALWLGAMIIQSLGQLFSDLVTLQALPQDIAGPVGIVHQASTQGIFAEGPLSVLSFAGMLSINLAILNLLPIPALDGGRAIFILLGQVVGQDKISRVEHWANYGGYFLLLGLIILVTIRDVTQLFL